MQVRLAVVRNDGKALVNGCFSQASDAANRAKKARYYAKRKNLDASELTCKFENFEISAINFGGVDSVAWSDRYYIEKRLDTSNDSFYWVVGKDNYVIETGLNNPKFTEEKARKLFAHKVNEKLATNSKIFHLRDVNNNRIDFV